jgi:hypothetical protein
MAVDKPTKPAEWPLDWMPAFLTALRNSANVRASCQAAGISRQMARKARIKWKTFADAWDESVEDALDVLEAVAFKRAQESSDYLLWKLLASRRRDVYGDAIRIDLDVQRAADRLALATGADAQFLIRRAQQLAAQHASTETVAQ